MTLLKGQQAAGCNDQQNAADDDRHDGFTGLIAEKIDTDQEQQDRQPKSTQPKQPDQDTGCVSPDDAKQIVDAVGLPGHD